MSNTTALLQFLAEGRYWQASYVAGKLVGETESSAIKAELARLVTVILEGLNSAQGLDRLKVMEIEWNLCMMLGRRPGTKTK